VQLEPDNATNHHNLATTLYRLGRYQQAEMAFAYAIKINPKQPLSYSWHGDCLKMLGRYK
jgi:tetratricopeptide (TPR) repeat protein